MQCWTSLLHIRTVQLVSQFFSFGCLGHLTIFIGMSYKILEHFYDDLSHSSALSVHLFKMQYRYLYCVMQKHMCHRARVDLPNSTLQRAAGKDGDGTPSSPAEETSSHCYCLQRGTEHTAWPSRHMTITWCHMTITWCHMTITWPSHDVTWLSHDVSWLSNTMYGVWSHQ